MPARQTKSQPLGPVLGGDGDAAGPGGEAQVVLAQSDEAALPRPMRSSSAARSGKRNEGSASAR